MLYFDASFLVPLVKVEATSGKIEAFISGIGAQTLCTCQWTLVEIASALSREVRMKAMLEKDATRALKDVEAIIGSTFDILLPDASDYERAKDYVARFETGLRGGDALHLAVAARHRVKAVYSLDKVFVKAGKNLGLPALTGIRI